MAARTTHFVTAALAALLTLAAVGPAAAEMMIDVRGPADAPGWYVFEVARRIQDRLVNFTFPAGSAVLDARSDGTISELFLSKSSGDLAADGIALRTIREAAPFPFLPSEYGPLVIPLTVSWRPPR